jgi:hypothetical protein
MNSQNLANALWAYKALSTLQGVELPSCYAALCDLISGLESRDFNQEGLRALFHVHLMHKFSTSANVQAPVSYPAWLMTDAREAWMRNVRDETKISNGHRALVRVLNELGVGNQVERVTDDGCFSMDIYLPEYNVAVEYDGPSHYYSHNEDASSSSTATLKTRWGCAR